jgi:hypothetical protein
MSEERIATHYFLGFATFFMTRCRDSMERGYQRNGSCHESRQTVGIGANSRILRTHGSPPERQEMATATVLEQAEALSRAWTAGGELLIENEGSTP